MYIKRGGGITFLVRPRIKIFEIYQQASIKYRVVAYPFEAIGGSPEIVSTTWRITSDKAGTQELVHRTQDGPNTEYYVIRAQLWTGSLFAFVKFEEKTLGMSDWSDAFALS